MHSGIAAARRGMVKVLAKGIAERLGKADEESTQQLEAGVEALVKYIGPVADMFEEATNLRNGNPPLCEDVKQLPACVLKRLLVSEALQVQLENETHTLLQAWLWQSPHVSSTTSRLVLFKELAPLLRYHHMTTDFLAIIVSQCPLMQESGRLLSSVMLSAFAQRDALPLLVGTKTGKRNRGVGASDGSWELRASFTLEEVAALGPEDAINKWCGLVAGYPAYVRVERRTDKGDTLGVYLGIHLPSAANWVDDTLAAGVGLQWTITVSSDVKVEQSYFFSPKTFARWGWRDIFNKPWAEAVCEGSPHFPGGKLEVKATVWLVTKEE